MTSAHNPLSALLLLLLSGRLPTGVRCKKETAFVYSRLGGLAVLPCTGLASPNCSLVSWTFWFPGKGGQSRYTEEVSGGRVSGSDRSGRLSLAPGCSLRLRDLRVDDAGSYVCLRDKTAVSDVYLSLLAITSLSKVTELQPGGKLVLNCILFTYFDAGNCRSYSSEFNLSWATEDGASLTGGSRYELINHTRCNITLVTELRVGDGNRKWRCQVCTKGSVPAASQDFTSVFLFRDPATAQGPGPGPAPPADCPGRLPVSRIALCVALPLMVAAVAVVTWRSNRKKAKLSAAAIELQEMS